MVLWVLTIIHDAASKIYSKFMQILQFFLCTQIRCRKSSANHTNDGFTLIELLVAMVMSVLIITPLLGFMLNILQTDKVEQAKAVSEQEIQAAINYIAQDLKQAIYIYDAKGIKAIRAQLPNPANSIPVLVFWKREILPDNLKIPVPNLTGAANRDDAYVYSLVAYYQVNNNNTAPWSNQQTIRRFSVRGGFRDPQNQTQFYNRNGIDLRPEPGFRMFDLEVGGTLEDKMNSWRRDGNFSPGNVPIALVDFIDSTPLPAPATNPPDAFAHIRPVDCTTIFTDKTTQEDRDALTVPAFVGIHKYTSDTEINTGSFYACVDVDRQIAHVYIRGNALARLRNNDNTFDPAGEVKQADRSFFPKASVQVRARGVIGVD